jgi:hypothetical protein
MVNFVGGADAASVANEVQTAWDAIK